ELALTEIGIGIPAADIVVDGHARKPLSYLVECAIPAHAVEAMLRNLEGVVDRDRRLPTVRREWRRQVEPHHCVVDSWLNRSPVDAHILKSVSPLESAHAPSRVGWKERRAFAAGAIEILVGLEPHELQSVGRVVGVSDLNG